MRFLAFLDKFALPRFRRPAVSEYASEVAQSIERLADMAELIADGLFVCAAGAHTDNLEAQRNMAAVFREDAQDRYRDVLRKLNPAQRKQMGEFINEFCKSKGKKR